jgi:hypothetical protein
MLEVRISSSRLQLPNPSLGNGQQLVYGTQIYRATDGTYYTYNHRANKYIYQLVYQFILELDKYQEAVTFFQGKSAPEYLISETWRSSIVVWLGMLVNRSDFVTTGRYAKGAEHYRGEKSELTLVFRAYNKIGLAVPEE